LDEGERDAEEDEDERVVRGRMGRKIDGRVRRATMGWTGRASRRSRRGSCRRRRREGRRRVDLEAAWRGSCRARTWRLGERMRGGCSEARGCAGRPRSTSVSDGVRENDAMVLVPCGERVLLAPTALARREGGRSDCTHLTVSSISLAFGREGELALPWRESLERPSSRGVRRGRGDCERATAGLGGVSSGALEVFGRVWGRTAET